MDLTDRLYKLADAYEHGAPWPQDEIIEAADEIEKLRASLKRIAGWTAPNSAQGKEARAALS